ncbi:MAG: DUF1840 domain-containing protein [Steroidobacteraceae bacterium]
MLIRFKSVATEPVTMFGSDALLLIKMLGASGNLPGAIAAEDIPAALTRLRQQLEIRSTSNPDSPDTDEDDTQDHEQPIVLAVRAGPLIDILERASAANAPLMWEQR